MYHNLVDFQDKLTSTKLWQTDLIKSLKLRTLTYTALAAVMFYINNTGSVSVMIEQHDVIQWRTDRDEVLPNIN